jgi:pantothenate kinase
MAPITSLIENTCNKITQIAVANAILKFQDLKEESWNGKIYTKTDNNCAIESCKYYNLETYWIYIVLRLNHQFWNDIRGWAKYIINTNNNEE